MKTNEELLNIAKEASKNSYSPYSKFPVGACVLYENGNTYSGCNIENSSYQDYLTWQHLLDAGIDYYYEGMSVESSCLDGYSSPDVNKYERLTFTCTSDGTWTASGKCIK